MAIINFDDILKTGFDEDALTTFTPGELIRNFGNLTTTGELGEGIFAAADGVSIDNRGSIETSGDGAGGILVVGNDAHIENRGAVITHGGFFSALEVFSDAISAFGDRFFIANYGTVFVDGEAASALLGGGADGVIVNYGTVQGITSDTVFCAAFGDRSQVINRGQVMVNGDANAAMFAAGEDASILNLGVVVVTGDGNAGMFGVIANADVTNKGAIHATGDRCTGLFGVGDGHQLSNFGLVETHGMFSIGMSARGGGPLALPGLDLEVANFGRVATEGDFAMGVAVGVRPVGFSPAEGAQVANSGKIETVGDGAAGVVLIGDEHYLTNSGRITTDGASADAGFAEFSAAGVLVSGDDVVVMNKSTGVIQSKDAASAAVELNVLEHLGLPAADMSSLLENSGLIKGAALAILGGAGEETVVNHGRIIGDVNLGGGADSFTFGAGGTLSGSLTLGGGDDLVVIENGAGKARIADFAAGSSSGDKIDVSAFFLDFNELTAASSQRGNDVLIALDNNDSLLLENVQLNSLNAGDFWFV